MAPFFSGSVRCGNADQRIEEAFDLLGNKDAQGNPIRAMSISVPFKQWRGGVSECAMSEAISEMVEPDSDVFAALLRVLEESRCEHVKALRKELSAEWVRRHADAIDSCNLADSMAEHGSHFGGGY